MNEFFHSQSDYTIIYDVKQIGKRKINQNKISKIFVSMWVILLLKAWKVFVLRECAIIYTTIDPAPAPVNSWPNLSIYIHPLPNPPS